MRDIERARARELLREGYTLALVSKDSTYTSDKKGIRPLLEFLDTGADLAAYSAADKVVGRGAAFLYIILGVRELFAGVISESAYSLLSEGGVAVEYGERVERILNRTGDGFCPIESCVMDITEPCAALKEIKERLEELSRQEVLF